jgi:hypothetical protein
MVGLVSLAVLAYHGFYVAGNVVGVPWQGEQRIELGFETLLARRTS